MCIYMKNFSGFMNKLHILQANIYKYHLLQICFDISKFQVIFSSNKTGG